MTSHAHCDHPATKAERARCRRQRQSQRVGYFDLAAAYAINDMWATLNTRQEKLLSEFDVAHTTCEYCETDAPCFIFPKLGINVCGSCERTHDVHEYEREI